jgi:hypothetical protein
MFDSRSTRPTLLSHGGTKGARFLLQRPMTRRPETLRSAVSGISTGVNSRGTRGTRTPRRTWRWSGPARKTDHRDRLGSRRSRWGRSSAPLEVLHRNDRTKVYGRPNRCDNRSPNMELRHVHRERQGCPIGHQVTTTWSDVSPLLSVTPSDLASKMVCLEGHSRALPHASRRVTMTRRE